MQHTKCIDQHACCAPPPTQQGTTRWEIMQEPARCTASLRMDCGHCTFDTPPLAADLEVVGRAAVRLCVQSSDGGGDVFCYLLDVNPSTGDARY